MHEDAPIKIGQAIIAKTWDCGPLKSHDGGCTIFFTESDGPQFSCQIFNKTDVLPL